MKYQTVFDRGRGAQGKVRRGNPMTGDGIGPRLLERVGIAAGFDERIAKKNTFSGGWDLLNP